MLGGILHIGDTVPSFAVSGFKITLTLSRPIFKRDIIKIYFAENDRKTILQDFNIICEPGEKTVSAVFATQGYIPEIGVRNSTLQGVRVRKVELRKM
jgi:hypothetical protein